MTGYSYAVLRSTSDKRAGCPESFSMHVNPSTMLVVLQLLSVYCALFLLISPCIWLSLPSDLALGAALHPEGLLFSTKQPNYLSPGGTRLLGIEQAENWP